MKYKLIIFLLLLMIMSCQLLFSQNREEIPLYEGAIPNEVPGSDEITSEVRPDGVLIISKVRKPTMTVYLPPKEKSTGAAVIIYPGGGYSILAAGHEGKDVAEKFNEKGIAAFVVKYRLPDVKITSKPEITPLQDAQQAIYLVRKKAREYNIDPQKIGVMGFSAGGHLASTAGTHYDKVQIKNPENISLRPDFMILIYPVISSDLQMAHRGSFKNLLGENASKEKLKEYSNELQVDDKTPPAFLVHASDDEAVKSENSIVFYQALLRHKIPAELHIYQAGGHGFGLINKTTEDRWFDICINWMRGSGWL
jgi:acetyl esterase/lipase